MSGTVVGVQVEYLPIYDAAWGPLAYKHPGDAGFDLRACFDTDDDGTYIPGLTLHSGDVVPVSAGIKLAIPEGFEVQVRPRSGMAGRFGVTLANSPGTIDSGYRGEVVLLLVNLKQAPVQIKRGDRVAQGVIAPVVRGLFVQVSKLRDETERGAGGFGSTGRT